MSSGSEALPFVRSASLPNTWGSPGTVLGAGYRDHGARSGNHS